jgi:hypothetical protein
MHVQQGFEVKHPTPVLADGLGVVMMSESKTLVHLQHPGRH